MKLEFTVTYSITVGDALKEQIKILQRSGAHPSELVKYIKNETGQSLHISNCIRKCITEGTFDYHMDL